MRRRLLGGVDESVWGKARGLDPGLPPYPLVRHLLDAAAVALFLWDRYLSEGQRLCIARGLGLAANPGRARGFAALCAGLHDLGKLSGFQLCDVRAREGLSGLLRGDLGRIGVERMRHEVAGMHAAAQVLAALGFRDGDSSVNAAVRRVAEVIGGHHGRFHEFVDFHPDNADLLGGEAWAGQRVAHGGAVFTALGSPEPVERVEAPAAVLVTGLVILSDWLVSQEHYLRARQRSLDISLEGHFTQSCADAERLVREAGLLPVDLEYRGFAEAYGIVGEPNALQRSVAEELAVAVGEEPVEGRRGGIMLVTAAPGDGKSETAMEAERVLAGRFGTRGFAFLLPTMATSDQMYLRVAGVVDRQAGQGTGLTLTHSMAWLNSAYAEDEAGAGRVLTCEGDEEETAGRERRERDLRPRRWLRGARRPLLAQFAVGTVDQALMAVLPVRHNALRLLALSNKTFVVDEAHAYDPYMQVLLGRLLNWLGWFGVPVVLLSATLPRSVSDRLVKEYLRGARRLSRQERRELEGRTFAAPYPGWLFVDGADGTATAISAGRQAEQAAGRRMDLSVRVEPVVHGEDGGGRSRLAVVERLLEPLAGEAGGCALVVCNTVPEAQATYLRLRGFLSACGHDAGQVQLLHARFPADEREARTRLVTEGLGRSGPRPGRRIVVATQVVEQSLDLDADVVISDLAPLALLLQRAGRGWRHEAWWAVHGRPGGRPRPVWARQPELIVLDPLAAGRGVPGQWGEVYAEFLLLATSQALSERGQTPVAIPHDVQDLVEQVHGDQLGRFDWDDPAKSAAYTAFRGKELAQKSVGDILVIPRARSVAGLHGLHHLDGAEEEWEAATRLGADAVRLLCVYAHHNGTTTLDPAGSRQLPGLDGPLSVADVRAVMGRTIPVNADWFRGEREAHLPPVQWAEHPLLGDLVVLRQPVSQGRVQPVRVGGKSLRLDPDLGLVRT
ncbi:CRISPR-associated helicase Cas3' [Streptomyces sp. NPDC051287]|uniref:CRISPR-associated helicase Cas3' n=1 Tax=Streptomyces sp. NPDC051287 TaxID=3365648 RepID=UPI00379D98C1